MVDPAEFARTSPERAGGGVVSPPGRWRVIDDPDPVECLVPFPEGSAGSRALLRDTALRLGFAVGGRPQAGGPR